MNEFVVRPDSAGRLVHGWKFVRGQLGWQNMRPAAQRLRDRIPLLPDLFNHFHLSSPS